MHLFYYVHTWLILVLALVAFRLQTGDHFFFWLTHLYLNVDLALQFKYVCL